LAWQLAAWGALISLWALWFQVFLGKMLPRFAYLTGKPIGNDPPCVTPECDFSAFWPAGLLARQHDYIRIYDAGAFLAYQRHAIAPSANLDAFFYPPSMLFPSMLISYLPYEWAFFVWTAAGLILAAWLMRKTGFSWLVVVAGLLSPAALWNTELGQLGTIADAILLGGIILSASHPLKAGGVLGLLGCKPQIGILVPVMLIGQRNWRACAGFGMTCVAIVSASMIWLGPLCLLAYHQLGAPRALAVLNAPFNPRAYMGDGVSVFWMTRSLGAGLFVSYAVQGIFSLFAALTAAKLWTLKNCAMLDKAAMMIFLSLLATPYGYGDDMVAWSWVLAALAERRGWRIGMVDVLFWLWPAFCQPISMATGVLFTPVVVILALARTWLEARRLSPA
jgi:hypothetical protein